MIVAGTRFAVVRVPLERIVITEHQPRYPERVQHYVRLLSDPAHATSAPGLVHLVPYGQHRLDAGDISHNLFTLRDGHHRYVAHLIAGRRDILGLLEVAPGEALPGGIVCLPVEAVT